MVYAPSGVKLRLSLFSLLYYTHRLIQAKLGRGHLSSISTIPTLIHCTELVHTIRRKDFLLSRVSTPRLTLPLACLLSPYSFFWIKNFNFLTRNARALDFRTLHGPYAYTRKHRNCRRSPFNYHVQRLKTGSCPFHPNGQSRESFCLRLEWWNIHNSGDRQLVSIVIIFLWNLVCFVH